jgi:hypothetical protein
LYSKDHLVLDFLNPLYESDFYLGWHEETIAELGMRKSLDRPLTLANGWTSNSMI